MPDVQPIPKAGVKRGKSMYRKAQRTLMERSQGMCEARIAAVCTGRYEHAHHIRRRSQGGSDTAENLLACCEECHARIHANPTEAQALGLLSTGPLLPPSSAVLSVTRIAEAIGLRLEWVKGRRNRRDDLYILHDDRAEV